MYDKTTPVRKHGLHERDTGSSPCFLTGVVLSYIVPVP